MKQNLKFERPVDRAVLRLNIFIKFAARNVWIARRRTLGNQGVNVAGD